MLMSRKDGFVTAYGSSKPDEDFVETIANYVVKSDAEWQNIMSQAGTVGGALIQEKLDMVTEYLSDSWELIFRLCMKKCRNASRIYWKWISNIKMIKTE